MTMDRSDWVPHVLTDDAFARIVGATCRGPRPNSRASLIHSALSKRANVAIHLSFDRPVPRRLPRSIETWARRDGPRSNSRLTRLLNKARGLDWYGPNPAWVRDRAKLLWWVDDGSVPKPGRPSKEGNRLELEKLHFCYYSLFELGIHFDFDASKRFVAAYFDEVEQAIADFGIQDPCRRGRLPVVERYATSTIKLEARAFKREMRWQRWQFLSCGEIVRRTA